MLARVWLLWAIALTSLSAIATARLTRLRMLTLALLETTSQGRSPGRDRSQSAGSRCPSKRQLQRMLVSLCALLEGAFGWITGSAWTTGLSQVCAGAPDCPECPLIHRRVCVLYIVLLCTGLSQVWLPGFPTLPMFPTAGVVVSNVCASLFASLLAFLWLVYLSDEHDPYGGAARANVRREDAERFFVTNAFSFFVGWTYISWMRDLVTIARVGLGEHGANWGAFGEILVVVCFGPLLTVLLIRLKSGLLARYPKQADRAPLTLARILADDDTSGGGVHPAGAPPPSAAVGAMTAERFEVAEPPQVRRSASEPSSWLAFEPIVAVRRMPSADRVPAERGAD
jgi:hypothetical protein